MDASEIERTEAASARAVIAEQIARFISAFDGGDADTLLSIYSDDLVKLRQGAPDEPKVETARRLRESFERFHGHLQVENVETMVSGDLAFARGSFVVTLTPKDGGETQIVRRRYIEIWRRESGLWRVIRTMDNSAQ
jgi:ketosteroid isomerase-like protein